MRTGAKIEQILIDFTNPKEISAVMTRVFKKPVDSALIAHGVLTRQEDVKNIRAYILTLANATYAAQAKPAEAPKPQ